MAAMWLLVLDLVLALLVLLLVVATALPAWPRQTWWVRAFEFPRPQLLAMALAALAWLAVVAPPWSAWEVVGAAALVLVVSWQALRVLPFTPLYRKRLLPADGSDAGERLSLIVANVLMDNREAEGLLDSVRGKAPDLLLAMETDEWWRRRLDELEDEYPHAVKEPLGNTYGMLLYSRRPLLDARVEYLVEDEIPSIHAAVELAGRRVELRCLHPKPPYPEESEETTTRDGELLMVAREAEEQSAPMVVAGDFNDVSWSRNMRVVRRVSGLLDPRIGRGVVSTFSAHNPAMRWALDHVFVSSQWKLVAFERLPAFGSDHFPLYAELCLEPAAAAEQGEPEPREAEEREAEDKIRRAQQR